jgi:peroxiredoxin
MKKSYAFAFAIALCFIVTTGTALAQGGSGAGKGIGTGARNGQGGGMGVSGGEASTPVADFTLPDTSGKQHSLKSIMGEKGTVLIFISTQCPVSNAYNERMEKLAQDYKGRGISVVGINANAPESMDDIKAHAAQHNLTFMILKDAGNKVADQLDATNTPEVFFLDASGKLVYRGRIDNSRSGGQSISSNDLRDAIEATLGGKAVTNSFVRAFGCSIKRG